MDSIIGLAEKQDLTSAVKRFVIRKNHSSRLSSSDLLEGAERALDGCDYESSVVLATKAIELSPQNGSAYLMRGKARYNSTFGKTDEAIEDLERAIQLGAKGDVAWEYLARLYDAKKKPDKAIDALTRAIELNPDKYQYYKFRAALYTASRKYEQAESDYNEYAKRSDDDAMPYFVRAKFFQLRKQYDKALADFDKCLTFDYLREEPDKLLLILKYRASLLVDMGRYQQALDNLDEVIKLDPKDEDAYTSKGSTYMKLKDLDRAIDSFTKAISVAPDTAHRAYRQRSRAYSLNGRAELADRDRKKAESIKRQPAEKPLYKLN